MLYWIAEQLGFPGVLNLLRYLTFRTGGATVTALFLSLLFGPVFIRWLKTHQKEGQPIRDDGPQSHLITKIGTPEALDVVVTQLGKKSNNDTKHRLLTAISEGLAGRRQAPMPARWSGFSGSLINGNNSEVAIFNYFLRHLLGMWILAKCTEKRFHANC